MYSISLYIVQHGIADTVFNYYWNRIAPGYILEILEPVFCGYSARSQMALGIPMQKQIQSKRISLLGPKTWSKLNPSIKNVKITTFFMDAQTINILIYLQV